MGVSHTISVFQGSKNFSSRARELGDALVDLFQACEDVEDLLKTIAYKGKNLIKRLEAAAAFIESVMAEYGFAKNHMNLVGAVAVVLEIIYQIPVPLLDELSK